MSAQNVRVGIIFSASLRGFQQFRKLGGGMTGLAGAVKKVRGEFALLGAMMAFDFFKSSLQVFAAFDHSMKKVQAVTAATTDQLAMLTAEARQLGRDFPFTASEAADAMFELSLAGLEVAEVMTTTETVLNLAMAGNMQLAQSARIAVQTMNAFGMEAEDVVMIGDRMTAGFTNSAMTLSELGAGLSFVGPVAAIANVSLEDSITVLGLFANAGVVGARSGTTFRQMLSKMLDPTTDAARRMNLLGLSFTDANGDLLPMVDILQQMTDAALTANDVITIFGIRAAPGVGALMQQGVEGFTEFNDAVNDSDGELKKIADTMQESAQNQFKMFTSAMEDLKIVVGAKLMPIMNALINGFRGPDGLGVQLTNMFIGLGTLFLAFAKVAGIMLYLLITIITPLTEAMAKHPDVVQAIVFSLTGLWIMQKMVILSTVASTIAIYAKTVALVGLRVSFMALIATIWPFVAAMAIVSFAMREGTDATATCIVGFGLLTLYMKGYTIATAAATVWSWLCAAALWAVAAAEAAALWPLTLIVLGVIAVIAIFIYWEEVLYGVVAVVYYMIEAIQKLANLLTLGIFDFGGKGQLWDDWTDWDDAHFSTGGMVKHDGWKYLHSGELVKPAGAIDADSTGQSSGGSTNNIQINVTPQTADSTFASSLVQKLGRMQRLGLAR